MAAKNQNIKDFKTELPGRVNDNMYVFPTVISKSVTGKDTFWTIYVYVKNKNNPSNDVTAALPILDNYYTDKELPGLVACTKVDSKIGADGKVKDSAVTITEVGKNIGKENSTNAFTQALRDALSKYNKAANKTERNDDYFPPMLASEVSDLKKLDLSACFMQFKLNGVRVVSVMKNNQVICYSRTRKEYPGFTHIKEQLLPIFQKFAQENPNRTLYIDGELYTHGDALQYISGLARKLNLTPEDIEKQKALQYYIYDCFITEEPEMLFSQRYAIITQYVKNAKDLVLVETKVCETQENTLAYYKYALEKKYEGIMVRLNSKYVFSYNDYHCSNLLKLKPVHDSEFKIINYTSGTNGKSKDVLLFECITPTNSTFTVNLGLPIEERKMLFRKMADVAPNGKTVFENDYKDKMLTVLFDELSEDGTPLRARTEGIVLRDYE